MKTAKEMILQWGVPIVAHGIAWGLATWLTIAQPVAEEYGGSIAGSIGAIAIVLVSIWDSLKGRKKVKE